MNRSTLLLLPLFSVVLLLFMITAACRHEQATIYPWGWEKLDRPSDSLMSILQLAFLGDASLDSCRKLVGEFHKYADKPDAPSIEKARALFWDARLAFAGENYEESKSLFQKALAATDSSRYPYDAKYIHLCLEPFEGKIIDGSSLDWEWYRRMTDDLDYCLTHDARFLGALRAQFLSCVMTYSGNASRALHYALMADSLFTGIGRDGDRLANRMNVAAGRVLTGDTAGALRDYEWMQTEIKRGVISASPYLEPLMDYNRWIEAKDTASLLRLRDAARNSAELRGYGAVASAYMADIELHKNETDSLPVRLKEMEAGLDAIAEHSQRALVLKTLSDVYFVLGNYNKAYEYLKAYPDAAEAEAQLLRTDKYSVAETERAINEIEQDRAAEKAEARVRMLSVTIAFLVVMIILAFLMYRWISRLRKERIVKHQAMEAARRAELSMSLSVCEKERQIEDLRLKLNLLADEEAVDADVVRRINSELISERAASKADEEFGRVFSSISPDFHKNLRQRYPRIGRNTLRMAEYIAIGMDNRHIARVMNIRPESVKQNRWRLRQALSLESDESLDKILREML